MSSTHRFRVVLERWKTARVWRAWSRCYLVGSVLKKCTRDRRVRELLETFRQTFLKPRRSFMLAAASAVVKDDEPNLAHEDACISDEDLENLLKDIEYVRELSQKTLFCHTCGKRLIIDKKQEGISYCRCKNSHAEPMDEWEPFMEADDVIIWRKEYKKGQGLYAYKVYGKYEDVMATDFAAVQLDGDYRRRWDDAVADYSVVQERVNGVIGQDIVHWEVLWPRMFANRDYVYIRRHKEFQVKSDSDYAIDNKNLNSMHNTKEIPIQPIDNAEGEAKSSSKEVERMMEKDGHRSNVHSRARRKSWENERKRKKDAKEKLRDNKVYIIASRSCCHGAAPESKHAVRVTEYWSHMVVRTLHGAQQAGMEFVLTYYDEPCVGGLPCGVTAWATGRAAPAYLTRMRLAAQSYQHASQNQQSPTPINTSIAEPNTTETPASTTPVDEEVAIKASSDVTKSSSDVTTPSSDVTKTSSDVTNSSDTKTSSDVTKSSSDVTKSSSDVTKPSSDVTKSCNDVTKTSSDVTKTRSDDAKSSGDVTKAEEGNETRDQSTQTDEPVGVMYNATSATSDEQKPTENSSEEDSAERNWWRYLYPFYYFI